MSASRELSHQLWSKPQQVRNICILAHVDHGKTTLTDHLLASNGLISSKIAGKARYMDSRPDEQERGITMKSSAVALVYAEPSKEQPAETKSSAEQQPATKQLNQYLVHVIDSPGHVDLSFEVTNAVRLCDGALVLVDVLEGVCVQTIAVLEQCWSEGLIPLLVMTKLDRLLTEVKMSSMEAYLHIRKLLEQINAITSTFVTRDAMKVHADTIIATSAQQAANGTAPAAATPTANGTNGTVDDADLQYVDYDESQRFEFLPEKNNVLFASAVDGWAFSIPQFATLFSKKLGFSAKQLQRALFGDYYFNPKTKAVTTKPPTSSSSKAAKPMFVSLILDNIWQLYDTVLNDESGERTAEIVKKLGITVPPRELAAKDTKTRLQAIMSRWLPLSQSVLSAVVERLPNPSQSQATRIKKLWPLATQVNRALSPEQQQLLHDVEACDPNSQHVVAYVSKMIDAGTKPQAKLTTTAIVRSQYVRGKHTGTANAPAADDTTSTPSDNAAAIPTTASEQPKDEGDEARLIAFARIYCGTLRSNAIGVRLHVIGPKFDPTRSLDKEQALHHITTVDMSSVDLYMLMATDFVPVTAVPAGNVCGIGGLGAHVLKTATLGTALIPPFATMLYQTKPIVRVAVEPVNASDIKRLSRALRLLNLADPNVQVGVQQTGEQTITAAGELHLDRCVRDLKERFAPGIQLRVSAPIVPFKETVVEAVVDAEEKAKEADQQHVQQQRTLDEKRAAQRRRARAGNSSDDDNDDDEGFDITDSHQLPRGPIVIDHTPNRACTLHIQALPLPETVVALLEANNALLKDIANSQTRKAKHRKRHGSVQNALEQATNGKDESLASVVVNGEEVKEDSAVGINRAALLSQIEQQAQHDAVVTASAHRDIDDIDSVHDNESLTSEAVSDATTTHAADAVTPSADSSVAEATDIESFFKQLREAFAEAGWKSSDVDRVWAFGPRRAGPNILINRVEDLWHLTSVTHNILGQIDSNNISITSDTTTAHAERVVLFESITSGIFSGFQLATASGPLCEEPMHGVAYVLEKIELKLYDAAHDAYGAMSGQVISTTRDLCRLAFTVQPQRLVEPMYACDLQCTADQLGGLYSVLNRRRGKVITDELLEGTSLFMTKAHLPVAESFGFATEMRKRTGGSANPQLVFSHWQTVNVDPNWIPTTQEELEDEGVAGLSEAERAEHNLARRLIDGVRRRKGLPIREKIVKDGSKNRTLARKK